MHILGDILLTEVFRSETRLTVYRPSCVNRVNFGFQGVSDFWYFLQSVIDFQFWKTKYRIPLSVSKIHLHYNASNPQSIIKNGLKKLKKTPRRNFTKFLNMQYFELNLINLISNQFKMIINESDYVQIHFRASNA